MSPDVSPDWLPDGWIVKVNRRDSGKVDRYFTCPISGSTFRSKNEVLHYLSFEKVDGLPKQSSTSRNNAHPDQNKLTALAQKNLKLMLPDGWILELKTRKSGLKAGTDYKCYIDPSSGRRFYSKADVFRYIEGGVTSRDKRKARTDSLDNTQISAPKHAGATAKRLLSGFPTQSSEENANVVLDVEELPSQDSGLHSSQGFGGSGPSSFAMQETNKISEGSILVEEPRTPHIHHGSRPDSSPEGQSEKYQEMIPAKAEMTREPLGYVNKETSCLSNLIILGKSQGNIVELENREISTTKITSHGRRVKKLAVRRSLRQVISREMAGHVNEASHNTSRCSMGMNAADFVRDKSDDVADTAMLTHTKEKCQSNNMNQKKCRLEMLPHQEEKDVDNSMPVNKSSMNLSKLELSSTKPEDVMHKKAPIRRKSYEGGALSQHVNKTQLKTIKGKLEISESHELQSSHGLSFEVNEKRQTRSSHHGSSSEVNEKRQTQSNHRGSSNEEIIMHDIQSNVHDLSRELIAKRQTRSSYHGSSSEVIAKHETRSSYRCSSSEAGAKGQTQSSQRGSSKANGTKLLCLPCRASKRLAAQQPDLTAMVDVSYRSLRKNLKRQDGLEDGSSRMTFVTNDHVPFKTPDNAHINDVSVQDACGKVSKEPLTIDPGMEKNPEAMKTDMNKKESTLESPFGDKWPDPCIEFAFRTLTGDIPLFEDSTTLANYFERVDTTESSCTQTNPDFKVLIQPDIPVQLDSINGLNATSKQVSGK